MSKKLSREKRKDLRARGQLRLVPRVPDDVRRAEQREEEAATSARVHEARAEIAEHEAERPSPKAPRRDLTVLVLVALVAAAGVIFWLTQRSPTAETKIDVGAPATTAVPESPVRVTLPAVTATAAATSHSPERTP